MKLHQIKYSGYGEILYGEVSCVCSENYHTEHQMKHHYLTDGKAETISGKTKHEKSKCTKKEEIKQVQTKHQPKLVGDSTTGKAFFLLRNVVDENTILLCPSNIAKGTTLYHVMLTADGIYLPYSRSVIAAGNEDMGNKCELEY
ncbi:hypothetical protein ACJMK2_038594 [Sinanodonta woodiana]|uniref:Uncharacterized protein n=1 Tax=Sinanodonta woodiana TaxID=1069815 RepID=A0ABD3WAB2_SINWO